MLNISNPEMPSTFVCSVPSGFIVMRSEPLMNAIFFPLSNHCGEYPPPVESLTASPPAAGIAYISVCLLSVGRSVRVTV